MARYAVNDESKIVHKEDGRDVNPKNLGALKMMDTQVADSLRAQGYRGCSNCNPDFDIDVEEEAEEPAPQPTRGTSGSTRRRALESKNQGEEVSTTVTEREPEGQEPGEEEVVGSEEEESEDEESEEEEENEEEE